MTSGTVGERIVELRRRRGWTQAQLVAQLPLSHSYVSLIEAGKRTPRRELLELIARKLDCTAEYLLTGRAENMGDHLGLELRFAELALRSGDAATARDRFAAVLDRATARGTAYRGEALLALWGRSRAEEALGDLEAALRGFEELAREPQLPPAIGRAAVSMTICRAYLAAGDLHRAIEVGEAALRDHEAAGDTFVGEELAELASTLVGCYYECGDLTRARLLAEAVIAGADGGGSLRTRALAAWDAAVVAEARGDLPAASRLTERALALYGEVGNTWAVASLQVNTAWLYLRMPSPDVGRAAELLSSALPELHEVGSPADIANAEAEQARCLLAQGDVADAVETARTALDRLSGGPGLDTARVRVVLADALHADGRTAEAAAAYAQAAEELTAAGSSRQGAEVWRQLAESFLELGMTTEALAAYRHVADAVGVQRRPPSHARHLAVIRRP